MALCLLALVCAGCYERRTSPGRQTLQSQLRQRDRGEALLTAAASQLSNLPSAVDTELRPPTIVLDSTKSANGQDVLAIATRNPAQPEGPVNVLHVPTGNGRFRSLGVRSGDILKYYVLQDETIDPERQALGMGRQLAMELTVAQVVDNSTLLIEEALAVEIPYPHKIEVWRYVDDRLFDINRQLATYWERRYPPLGWQPSPDEQVLTQIVAWLNQWFRQSNPEADWEPDPLLASLDHAYREKQALSEAALAAKRLEQHEGRLLQEAIWTRDIARWATGENFNDLDRASALFDWTVRNIQLVSDADAAAHRAWEVLLYGRGTAEQRAWVFALLARQQGMDVVMLSIASESAEGNDSSHDHAQFWLPALVLDDQLYLFDTRLGLPISDGEGVATLEQVRADPQLLRYLDLEGARYPVEADALQRLEVAIVADAFSLSWRAAQIEAHLTGDDRVRLTAHPSEVAQRLAPVAGLAQARLWKLPFDTLQAQLTRDTAARKREVFAFEPFAIRPLLWKARAHHFRGVRPLGAQADDEQVDDHQAAAQLYTSKSVRPPDRAIEQSTSADKRRIDTASKLRATYWVGLLSYDDGKYGVAEHWLSRPEIASDASPWKNGARYNLARTYEAQNKLAEAIALLEEDTSPQQHGNRLRARRLAAPSESAASSE